MGGGWIFFKISQWRGCLIRENGGHNLKKSATGGPLLFGT